MQSPGDSAISSGAPSAGTTKPPSVVADGDLEKFEQEDDPQDPQQGQVPPGHGQGYPPHTTGASGYPNFAEQQARGTFLLASSQKCIFQLYITFSRLLYL